MNAQAATVATEARPLRGADILLRALSGRGDEVDAVFECFQDDRQFADLNVHCV
jgi:hypothetical protein